MTRQKKSRNPGSVRVITPKEDKDTLFSSKDKKPKKKTGLKSGNRQQEATKKQQQKRSYQEKDPRLGSKKPIVLLKTAAKSEASIKQQAHQPLAKVTVVNQNLTIEEQITAIEDDARLLEISDQQEQGVALSPEDIDYYNEKMDEYQKLSEQLETDESPNTQNDKSLSEDELWDKFNDSDFSFNDED